jgi:hypothetical protein
MEADTSAFGGGGRAASRFVSVAENLKSRGSCGDGNQFSLYADTDFFLNKLNIMLLFLKAAHQVMDG